MASPILLYFITKEKGKSIVEVRKDWFSRNTPHFLFTEASLKGFKDLWAGVQFPVHNFICSHGRLLTLLESSRLALR